MLPVTIINGLTESGKTSLVKHILKTKGANLKIAFLVNDNISELLHQNVNQSEIEGEVQKLAGKDLIRHFRKGCICCSMADEFAHQLRLVAESGDYNYCVVECNGVCEVEAIAELFASEHHHEHEHEHEHEHSCCDHDHDHDHTHEDEHEHDCCDQVVIGDVARLDTCVTVINAEDFDMDLFSLETLEGRYGGLQLEEHHEQDISAHFIEQIEFSNVIIVNKKDLVTQDELHRIESAIRSVNMDADVIHAFHCDVPIERVIHTGTFDLDKMNNNAGWLQMIRRGDETDETKEGDKDTDSFVYRRRRPFHPTRFHDLTNESTLFNGENSGIIRIRGYVWIANHHGTCGGWNQTGRLLQMNEEGPFLASLDPEVWANLPQELRDAAQNDFVEPYGDHRQEIAFIGFADKMNKDHLCELLDKCLLTDDEFALGPERWANELIPTGREDPFEFWDSQSEITL